MATSFVCVSVSRAVKVIVDGCLLSVSSSSTVQDVFRVAGVEVCEGEVVEASTSTYVKGHQYQAALDDPLEKKESSRQRSCMTFGGKILFFLST